MIKEIYADLVDQTKTEKRGLFKTKTVEVPVYEHRYEYSKEELKNLEDELKITFPNELYDWLLLAGSGAISDSLLIGEKGYLYSFDNPKRLSGYISFARDDLANHYVLSPNEDGNVFYVCHDPVGYAKIAENISDFITQLKSADYEVQKLVNDIELTEFELKI